MLKSTKFLFKLPLELKLKYIEKIISNPKNNTQTTHEIMLNKGKQAKIIEKYELEEMRKPNRMARGFLSIFLLAVSFNSYGQTIDNVPIGEILASMPTGVILRDGTVLKAEVISLGTASPPYTDHGLYNQYEFGGIYNGVDDGALTPTGPDGLAISGYGGDKNPLNFTRINAEPRGDIDRGEISNFGNAIGFHFWADRPILAKELLLIDCDGSNVAGNQEWFTIFGYNGITAVDPSISFSASTELASVVETVNTSWHTLVDAEITGSVPSFTTKTLAKNTTGATPAINDPDDVKNQALFDFGTNKVDHLFILWGIRNDLAAGGHATTGAQNSGVSPLVFSFDFDYGDAPNTYGTNKGVNGPVHVIPTVPLLTLGASVTTENNGNPGPLANGDTDNGVASIDSVIGVSTLSDVIATYSITTSFNNTSGSIANYAAWIDWNNNGVFDASEGKTATTAAGTTTGTVTFTWTSQTLTRSSTSDANTFARIRMTTEAITTSNATNAPFQDGEVEDFLIPFAAAVPLPIRLISFSAEKQQDKINLNWQVAEQKDVDSYEILRSANGLNYTKIGSLKAENDRTKYSLTDEKPFNGMNLYQLKNYNLDGTFQIAPLTLSVFSEHFSPEILLYPNPTTKTITINTNNYDKPMELIVLNENGQKLMSNLLSKGINNIDISSLKKGIYYFNIMGDSTKLRTEKIEISK